MTMVFPNKGTLNGLQVREISHNEKQNNYGLEKYPPKAHILKACLVAYGKQPMFWGLVEILTGRGSSWKELGHQKTAFEVDSETYHFLLPLPSPSPLFLLLLPSSFFSISHLP
jgi:hypothetical protein